jgi:hypothetical protein
VAAESREYAALPFRRPSAVVTLAPSQNPQVLTALHLATTRVSILVDKAVIPILAKSQTRLIPYKDGHPLHITPATGEQIAPMPDLLKKWQSQEPVRMD